MANPVYELIPGSIPGVHAPDDPDGAWSLPPSPACAVQTRSQKQSQDKPFKPLKVPKLFDEIVTVDRLRDAQQKDLTLQRAREIAETKSVNE